MERISNAGIGAEREREEQMTEQYYIRKSNGRYQPVEKFNGLPADGIWVVKDAGKTTQFIMRLPHEPISTSMIIRKALVKLSLKEKILEALWNETKEAKSLDGLANSIAEKLLGEADK